MIEIGLAYGSSALAIAEALVLVHGINAHDLVIDAYQEHFHSAGWDTIVAAGVTEICSFVPRRSQLALPRLVEEGMSVDAAFVDGSHVFHNVFVDLTFLRELVRPDGLVVLDDCGWPSVATAVRYFEVNAGWQRNPTESDTRLRAYRLPDPGLNPASRTSSTSGFTLKDDREPHRTRARRGSGTRVQQNAVDVSEYRSLRRAGPRPAGAAVDAPGGSTVKASARTGKGSSGPSGAVC